VRHIIRHVTRYRYSAPITYSIQTLRLTPRQDNHQHPLRWHIDAPGELTQQADAYGNVTHILTLNGAHREIELRVTGQVDVQPLHDGVVTGEDSRLPVEAFCVPTPLTQSDETIRAFTADALPRGLKTPGDGLALAGAIHERVAYVPGITDVTTAAPQVLEMGHGVCQDHSHLFLACVHGLGLPARYVSGYLYTPNEHAATHAWVDVWLQNHGWVSIDVTNHQFASDCHCRLAVARDYDSASPVRGVRIGGGEESMMVDVQVDSGPPQSQHQSQHSGFGQSQSQSQV
jgi:transglutaminase-like putative cysteine protease